MNEFLTVMIGGALGSGARYGTGLLALRAFGSGYPFGTLIANLAGGLIMGILAGALLKMGPQGEPWRLLIGVGVLGGFTTFSSFSLEVVQMASRGALTTALGYILVSVVGAVSAVALGLSAARVLT